MAVEVTDPCSVLSALNDWQQSVLSGLTRRFGALQRLAQILEEAGDITGFLDDIVRIIPRLVPIEALDSLNAYNLIRGACPMLGLPEANIDAAAKLQTDLARAYAELLRKIDLHQFNRLDLLQARLDQVIGKAVNSLGRDWFICATTVCSATQDDLFGPVRSDVAKYLEIKSEIARGNLPGNTRTPFTIASESGAQKIQQLRENRVQISNLAKSEKAEIQSIVNRTAL
jgi:hypothetical protein